MKKLYPILLIIIVVVGVVWNIQKKNKTNTEIKQAFQQYITPVFSNGKERFLTDRELASANDRLYVVLAGNTELSSDLILEYIKAHPGEQSYGTTRKTQALVELMSYMDGREGVNKNIFNNLLKYAKSDAQNWDTYLSITTSYLQSVQSSCASSGWEMRPEFIRKWCANKNNPYNLVYDFLGDNGGDMDKFLIKATSRTFFDYEGKIDIRNYHYFAISLRKKYGSDIDTIKDDPVIKNVFPDGQLPNELQKELDIR